MNRFYRLISFLIFIQLVSCEKELDFKYHDISPQLVIEGLVSQDEVKVTLVHTTPMDEKIEYIYLTDGEVSLTNLSTGDKIDLEPDDQGVFRSEYIPVINDEYQLVVKMEGKEYMSSCLMRAATKILGLKFQWIKMPYDYVAVLQITFLDPESKDDCYWIKIYRNSEPYKWIMSDDRSAVNGVINEVIMTSRKDLDEEDEKDILKDGDEVKVVINTISREMYDYLIAIQKDSNGPSMFEGNFCLGYFMASDSVSDSIIYHPDELSLYQ